MGREDWRSSGREESKNTPTRSKDGGGLRDEIRGPRGGPRELQKEEKPKSGKINKATPI